MASEKKGEDNSLVFFFLTNVRSRITHYFFKSFMLYFPGYFFKRLAKITK